MDVQTLIVLFVLFGVVSSLINKLQERGRKDAKGPLRRPVPPPEPEPEREDLSDEKEIDLADWEALFRPRSAEPEPEPSEFQPVHGEHPVSEMASGPEFHEIHGEHPVSETDAGPEFHEIRGEHPISEAQTGPEYRPAGTWQPVQADRPRDAGRRPERSLSTADDTTALRGHQRRRRRRSGLNFCPQNVLQAIIYSEIIGPPRADNMP